VLVKLFYSCMCFLCNSRFKSSLELMYILSMSNVVYLFVRVYIIVFCLFGFILLFWILYNTHNEVNVPVCVSKSQLPHCMTSKSNTFYLPHLTLIRCDNSYFLFGNDWLSVATEKCIDRRSLQIHVFHECALSQYFVMKTIIPTVLQIQFWKYAK
jgi:hypothetical protein